MPFHSCRHLRSPKRAAGESIGRCESAAQYVQFVTPTQDAHAHTQTTTGNMLSHLPCHDNLYAIHSDIHRVHPVDDVPFRFVIWIEQSKTSVDIDDPPVDRYQPFSVE